MGQNEQWRVALASRQGTSHVHGQVPCQDSSLCEIVEAADGTLLVAAVSDGAGSARHSQFGSHLACTSFVEELRSRARSVGVAAAPTKLEIEAWLDDLRGQIAAEAERIGSESRDLACTFVGAVIAKEWSMFCQIGDGGIVFASGDGGTSEAFDIAFWPEQGEYANETYFVTMDDAQGHLQFQSTPAPVADVALFSDGLQRLVLDYKTQKPFDPFFHRLLQTLRREGAWGHNAQLSEALGNFLGSEDVSSRTDDDVSLVLATSRDVLPEPRESSLDLGTAVDTDSADGGVVPEAPEGDGR